MFQRVGNAAFKKDLSNTLAICEVLDNPHQKFKSIHVGGTNGKGSTSHIIASILQAQGLKVGMYTSPHYKDFRERIKINGKLISKRYVNQFVERHEAAFAEIRPSFFEWTVGLAFDYFADQKVDIAVIEVGLGGRLDSTNVLTPLACAITNISFDHVQFLGDTLPLIAGEKAGIIKSNIPVIIGEEQEETKPVFINKAKEVGAPITFAERHIEVKLKSVESDYQILEVFFDKQLIFNDLALNLMGDYQLKNVVTALATLHFGGLLDLQKSEESIREGLKNLRKLTRFIGRWQRLGESPTIIADSAHNEGGLKWAMGQLTNMTYQNLHFVLGAVNDKDIGKMLARLPKGAQYYFAKAKIPRGLDAKILKEKAAEFGLKGRAYSSVKNALKAAKRAALKEDLIYVGGSTFVVAEVV